MTSDYNDSYNPIGQGGFNTSGPRPDSREGSGGSSGGGYGRDGGRGDGRGRSDNRGGPRSGGPGRGRGDGRGDGRSDGRGDGRGDSRGDGRSDGRGEDRYDEERRGRRRGTPLSELDPALTSVSRIVIGSSIEVHKALGPGFPEEVYLNSLCMELDAAGVKYAVNHPFDVNYKGRKVGERRVGLFVDNRFVVEVRAIQKPVGSLERAETRSALRAADLELGLIINFAELRLKDGLVRVLNPDKLNAMRGDAGGEGAPHDDGDHADHYDDLSTDEPHPPTA